MSKKYSRVQMVLATAVYFSYNNEHFFLDFGVWAVGLWCFGEIYSRIGRLDSPELVHFLISPVVWIVAIR